MKMSIIAYLPPVGAIIGSLIGNYIYKNNQRKKVK